MVVSLDLKVFKMFKNAFFLILISFKKSMMAMLFIILSFALLFMYLIAAMMTPVTFVFIGALILLLHFSLQRLFINYYCFRVIIEEVIEPFYKEQNITFDEEIMPEETDKYEEDSNITEKSEYVYVNGKLVKRELLEQENLFKDDK